MIHLRATSENYRENPLWTETRGKSVRHITVDPSGSLTETKPLAHFVPKDNLSEQILCHTGELILQEKGVKCCWKWAPESERRVCQTTDEVNPPAVPTDAVYHAKCAKAEPPPCQPAQNRELLPLWLCLQDRMYFFKMTRKAHLHVILLKQPSDLSEQRECSCSSHIWEHHSGLYSSAVGSSVELSVWFWPDLSPLFPLWVNKQQYCTLHPSSEQQRLSRPGDSVQSQQVKLLF